MRVECARTNTQGLVSLHFFSLNLQPGANPNPSRSSAEGTVIRRWGDPKEGGWRWEPSTRRRGEQMTFQSSFDPQDPPAFGCPRLHLDVVGLTWIWKLWFNAEGTRHYTSKRALGLSHPSQLLQPQNSPALGSRDVNQSGSRGWIGIK